MVFSNNLLLGAVSAAADAYLIEQSLLFNDDDSAYLNRTPSVAGNRKTWTFSAWVKPARFSGGNHYIFSSSVFGDLTSLYFATNSGNAALSFQNYTSSSQTMLLTTSAVLRDPAAWYHIVVAVDTTQATSSDRIKIYVNGTQITSFSSSTYPSLNEDLWVNAVSEEHNIGAQVSGANTFDGLMALPILVDGAALAPTAFGETDDDGFWNPIEFEGEYNIAGSTPTVASSSAIWTGGSGWTFTADDISGAAGDSAVRTLDYAFSDDFSVEWTHRTTASSSYTFGVYPTASDGSFNSAAYAAGVFYTTGLTTSFSVRLDSPTTFSLWGGTSAEQSSIAIADNDVIKFERVGSTFKVYKNASLIRTMTFTSTSQMRIALGKGNVADLEAVSFDYEIVAGTNGFQLDYADTTFFGKNVSGTDDQAALSSAAPAATAWLNITGAWTMGSGTASRTTTVNAIRSASVFTGDFSLALTMASGATAARIGVYAANEDSTFVSSGADSAGMDSMTNSFYANFGAASFYKGSSTTASVSQTNGAITITRVSGTITINTAGGNHTFSATYTGPMRFVLAGGGATMSFTGIAYTADGQAGTSYFDTNFTTSDQLEDTPTDSADEEIGNFATFNPLNNTRDGGATLSNGNLNYSATAGNSEVPGTIVIPEDTTDTWVIEFTNVSLGSNRPAVGLIQNSIIGVAGVTGGASEVAYNNGGITIDTVGQGSITTDATIRFEYNGTDNEVEVFTAGVSRGTYSWTPAGPFTFYAARAAGTATCSINTNISLMEGTVTAGAKSFGTQNLPAPTIADGSQHMNTVLYTGTGSELAITSLDFTPDFVWIKNRDATDNHMLYDSVRGATKDLHSNTQDAETTTAQTLKSFDSAGFTLGTDVQVNTNTEDYVAWCWKAGGAAVSNTDGTITSSVSANTTSGFSIVSYTGSGTASDTVGHGLSTIPSLIIARNRTQSGSWCVTHESLSADKVLRFEGTNAEGDIADGELDSPPNNSSTFGFNNGTSGTPLKAVNASSIPYIAYCWSEVEGFSKFGSYTGNGSADGPFVYTGFIPACIIFKKVSSTSNWGIFDNSRDPYNEVDHILFPNLTNAEVTPAYAMDFLSNGVKLRNTSDIVNVSGQTYIYMAFAEQPFQGADGVTQARAR